MSQVIECLDDATRFILSCVHDTRSDPRARDARGLRAIEQLLARIGHPERSLRCLHIAGSKGKGSTALLVDGIARALGERTGLFTSPHLESWTERIRVAGEPVSEAAFTEAVRAVSGPVNTQAREDPELAPSFFDVLTAAALWRFAQDGVSLAILETGLGGRLDSTNIVQPLAVAITSIELEHTDRLGHTLAAIAGEKAGIIKPGVPVVAGRLPASAMAVVRRTAAERNAPLSVLGEDFEVRATGAGPGALSLQLDMTDVQLECALRSGARVMADNAALAAMLARKAQLFDRTTPVEATLARALAATALPGRCELLSERPLLVIDAAHTLRAVESLADSVLKHRAGNLQLLVSLSMDRDVALLAPLAQHAQRIIACQPDADRSAPAPLLAAALARQFPGVQVDAAATVAGALDSALGQAAPTDLIVATGSVYQAGAVRSAWRATPRGQAWGRLRAH